MNKRIDSWSEYWQKYNSLCDIIRSENNQLAEQLIDAKLYENIEKYIDEDIDLIKYKLQRVDENGKLLEITEGATFEKTSGQDGFNRLYDNDKLLDSQCVYIVKK